MIAELRGDLDEADALYEQAAAMFRELGEPRGLQVVAHDQANLRAATRRLRARARACSKRASRELESSAPTQTSDNVLVDLGILALHERRYDDSVPLFVESLESALRHGLRVNVALSLRGLAAATAVRGDLESAARMLGAAETIEEQIGEEM